MMHQQAGLVRQDSGHTHLAPYYTLDRYKLCVARVLYCQASVFPPPGFAWDMMVANSGRVGHVVLDVVCFQQMGKTLAVSAKCAKHRIHGMQGPQTAYALRTCSQCFLYIISSFVLHAYTDFVKCLCSFCGMQEPWMAFVNGHARSSCCMALTVST